jgi:hypothetical protein
MNKKPVAAGPDRSSQSLAQTLDRTESLVSMLARLKQSQRCWDLVSHLVEPEVAAQVRPGPLHDDQWVLLVQHASAAAKLRQLASEFSALLESPHLLGGRTIKVKVLPPS